MMSVVMHFIQQNSSILQHYMYYSYGHFRDSTEELFKLKRGIYYLFFFVFFCLFFSVSEVQEFCTQASIE